MSRTYRRVVVTGAGGFIGARLVRRLLNEPDMAAAEFVLCDLAMPSLPDGARVSVVEGDFGDAAVRDRLLDGRPDLVFHLAGVLGGAAEADYDLARRVNVDATLSLLEALRAPDHAPRVVFASSIAVFGPSDGTPIDDATETHPTLVYGAQKRMIEIALEQFSARGWLDAVALRLPGIVARPAADARLKSAFLNSLFYAMARGEGVTLPVSATGTTWLISVKACVDALIHSACLEPRQLASGRTLTLPAQRIALGDLVQALRAAYPTSGCPVSFEPEPEIEAQFGRQPELSTARADALGFQHDGNIDSLVRRALDEAGIG